MDFLQNRFPLMVSFKLYYRWLPLLTSASNYEGNANIVLLTIFMYSCNNLVEFADGSPITENEGIPEENQVEIQVIF